MSSRTDPVPFGYGRMHICAHLHPPSPVRFALNRATLDDGVPPNAHPAFIHKHGPPGSISCRCTAGTKNLGGCRRRRLLFSSFDTRNAGSGRCSAQQAGASQSVVSSRLQSGCFWGAGTAANPLWMESYLSMLEQKKRFYLPRFPPSSHMAVVFFGVFLFTNAVLNESVFRLQFGCAVTGYWLLVTGYW